MTNTTSRLARFNELTTRPIPRTDPYAPDDIFDAANEIARDILCDCFDPDYSYLNDTDTAPLAAELTQLIADIHTDPYSRHALSMILLDYSLCPMHECDYQACFDDDDPECSLIREYFPSHDT